MSKIYLNKKEHSKNQYEKVIDTKFHQLAVSIPDIPISSVISVEQFFEYYNQLFFQIPKTGLIDSHEYIIKKSSEYIDSDIINNDIQALIEEINLLQQQNLSLNQQLVDLRVSSSQI